jgi:hypothetical protein
MPKHLTKTVLLAGACMALAAPATAGIDLSGYGELGGGVGPATFSGTMKNCSGIYCSNHDSNTPTALVGDVHISVPLDAAFNFQFDAIGNRRFLGRVPYTDGPNSRGATKYGLGVHLDQSGDDYRGGILVSVGNSDWTWIHNRLLSAGLEGEWFLDRTTLFSQLIYSRAVQGYFAQRGLNSWYLYTGARYFLRDNLMFEADAGAGAIETGKTLSVYSAAKYSADAQSGNILHWSAKAEYRFEDLPASLIFNYQGSYGNWNEHLSGSGVYPYPQPYQYTYDVRTSWGRTENLFMLSLRYYFGGDSLIANDRHGAGMNDYNPWYGAEPIMEPFMDNEFYPAEPPVL